MEINKEDLQEKQRNIKGKFKEIKVLETSLQHLGIKETLTDEQKEGREKAKNVWEKDIWLFSEVVRNYEITVQQYDGHIEELETTRQCLEKKLKEKEESIKRWQAYYSTTQFYLKTAGIVGALGVVGYGCYQYYCGPQNPEENYSVALVNKALAGSAMLGGLAAYVRQMIDPVVDFYIFGRGPFEARSPKGHIEEGYWDGKFKQGPYRCEYPDGAIETGNYIDGVRAGEYEVIYKEEGIRGKGRHENGKKNGICTYTYPDGSLRGTTSFKDDEKHGKFRVSYSDSHHIDGSYEMGKKQKDCKVLENGRILHRGKWTENGLCLPL